MTADALTTVIIHHDTAWCDRVAAMLGQRGLRCVALRGWPGSTDAGASRDVAVAVVQVSGGDRDSVAPLIIGVRDRFPDCGIIAVAPQGDSVATRAAFRAGAWDCLENPADAAQIAECVTEVLQGRATRDKAPDLCRPIMHRCAATLPEHSAFLDALAGLRCLCRRHGRALSIMMLDLDRFRECNERHSPAFGDQVLGWFGSLLSSVCRRSDVVARYQGDRFIVALPDSRAWQAAELAQRCHLAMRERPVLVEGCPLELTVGIGIAESTAGFIETEHQLIQRARLALTHAKHQGSDTTVTWSEVLSARPPRRTFENLTIEGVSHWVERLRLHLRSTYVESTRALVAAVEAKDPYTQAHSLTVSTYAETIGKRMQLPSRMIETLRAAALLHDVGKIGVPDAILTKPGPLTEEEFNIIKRHPETALEILEHVSFLSDERPLILHHHERYDGTGYPAGLAGDGIPIGARILAVADALDTMFSPRSYKEPYHLDRVRSELVAGSGRQFDPTVTNVTLQWLDESPPELPHTSVMVSRGL
jgi:diguanylate cyclase (GGDEF)-like protein